MKIEISEATTSMHVTDDDGHYLGMVTVTVREGSTRYYWGRDATRTSAASGYAPTFAAALDRLTGDDAGDEEHDAGHVPYVLTEEGLRALGEAGEL